MSDTQQCYNQFPPVGAGVGKRTPGNDFIKIPLPQSAGYHTGGVYLSPDGKSVFKALDCRTDHGDDAPRMRTQEDVLLEIMAGSPAFPRNWHVEDRNGRTWLVRPFSLTVPGSFPLVELRTEDVRQIEEGIRALNERNWEIGDLLEVAVDPLSREPFVLDLSCAYYRGPRSPEIYRNEYWRFEIWAERVGFGNLTSFRRSARRMVETARFKLKYPRAYRYVYASMLVPFHTPASHQDALVIDADYGKTGVYTWVVFPRRLDAADVELLNLTWGWSPLAYEGE
jgi:hypothetical protein